MPDDEPDPSEAFEEYAEHRTGAEMDAVLHHHHWIPVQRGYARAHVDEHFPGWTLNELVDVCRAAGIAQGTTDAPLRCDPRVTYVHFTDAATWAVEWSDLSVTTSP